MENIMIFPSSEKEKYLIEEFLQKMKVRFKTLKEDKILLTDEEISDIKDGLKDFEDGNFVSSKEIREMLLECLK